jgi:hypothetical protein
MPLAGRTREYFLKVVFTLMLAHTEKTVVANSKIKYTKSK